MLSGDPSWRDVLIVALLAGVVVTAAMVGGGVIGGDEPTTEAAAPGENATVTPNGSATSIHFEDVTEASGFAYASDRTGSYSKGNEGLYVADVDRDGWQDVLAIGGKTPSLFENRNGSFRKTGQLDSIDREYRTATFVDYDGDGWRDLLLFGKGAPVAAFHNEAGELVPTDLGLGNTTYPAGAIAADFDTDGDEDLYLYQSGTWGEGSPEAYNAPIEVVGTDNGAPNLLFENRDDATGTETFRRVSEAEVAGGHWTLGSSAVDLTGDGLPDIHAANDFWYDFVYVNQGNMTFEPRRLGRATARNAMESEVGDVNRDGHPDIFVTNIYLPVQEMSRERYERLQMFLGFVSASGRTKGNNLLLGDGSGNFTDRAPAYGVRKGGWGWGAALDDFDNDGDEDLLHTTQYVVRIYDDDPHYTYPMLWERTGERFRSLDASEHGLQEADGRGMVTLDYDRDGDLEAITNNIGGNVTVYDNVGRTGNAVQFDVLDADGSTALGAVVNVSTGGETRTVHVTDETGFLSQSSLLEHVGIGDAETATLEIRWPDGTERTVTVEAGTRVRITREGVETVCEF